MGGTPDIFADVKKTSGEDADKIITKYEGVLESIYEKQTRGDYTFRGILIAFLWEYNTIVKGRPEGPVYRS